MSFTVNELDGYVKGERYEKQLTFVEISGDSNHRLVVLEDEDGVRLLWSTSDRTKAYKEFKLQAKYRFTVDHILNIDRSLPKINIQRLSLVD